MAFSMTDDERTTDRRRTTIVGTNLLLSVLFDQVNLKTKILLLMLFAD